MTPERSALLAELLEELLKFKRAGNNMPPAVFEASLPLFPQLVIEFLVFRSTPSERKIEILLVERPSNVAYPNQWHCPGTFVRPGDAMDRAFERARIGKLGGAIITQIEFLTNQLYVDPNRNDATILRMVYTVQIAEEDNPPKGKFFEIYPNNNLPAELVWEQPMLIDLFPIPNN
ncbi:MAG: hypothetical protein K8Q97_00205 [Candidatus Andersenbacteria bacterium]|nr:hypothetical protein [Candidatus Andersenbacteria bacterium]